MHCLMLLNFPLNITICSSTELYFSGTSFRQFSRNLLSQGRIFHNLSWCYVSVTERLSTKCSLAMTFRNLLRLIMSAIGAWRVLVSQYILLKSILTSHIRKNIPTICSNFFKFISSDFPCF